MSQDHKKSGIKKHAHEVAHVSALVASKTRILYGKTLILFAFHAIRFIISSSPCIALLDSAENQLGNFLGRL